MASTGDLMGTAISGLIAFQRGLSTTGQNIANVNTEGYSRQTVELAARAASITGSGFIGNGVNVTTVQRIYDQFLFEQVTTRSSSYNYSNTLYTMSSRLDEVLGSDSATMDSAIQAFFDSMQDVANDPTSIPAREVLLSNASSLVNRFTNLNNQIEASQDSVNAQLEVMTEEISGIAQSIADLNQEIALQTGLAGGQPPNDLLDQRDLQLSRLAELVDIKVVDADDGSINVFIGSGQSLVLGAQANALEVSRNSYDQSQLEVNFVSATTSFSISDQINGGQLGGLLEFRSEVLVPAQNALGLLAIGISDAINTQHQLGDDLNGNAGGLFFNDIISSSPEVLANANNNAASGTISVTIDDANLLRASDYQLNYDGTNFSLIRLSDNTVVDSGFTTGDLPRTIASDGITIDLTGTVASGDSFLIRPVQQGAADLRVTLTDPYEFAAAGTGNATGDNSNTLAMVALQNQSLLGNGTETFQTAYSRIVASVGVKTSEAEANASSQKSLLDSAISNQQSLSGVNLDEEAANLLKYQQAYQAAARVITVADEIFQTLINATS